MTQKTAEQMLAEMRRANTLRERQLEEMRRANEKPPSWLNRFLGVFMNGVRF